MSNTSTDLDTLSTVVLCPSLATRSLPTLPDALFTVVCSYVSFQEKMRHMMVLSQEIHQRLLSSSLNFKPIHLHYTQLLVCIYKHPHIYTAILPAICIVSRIPQDSPYPSLLSSLPALHSLSVQSGIIDSVNVNGDKHLTASLLMGILTTLPRLTYLDLSQTCICPQTYSQMITGLSHHYLHTLKLPTLTFTDQLFQALGSSHTNSDSTSSHTRNSDQGNTLKELSLIAKSKLSLSPYQFLSLSNCPLTHLDLTHVELTAIHLIDLTRSVESTYFSPLFPHLLHLHTLLCLRLDNSKTSIYTETQYTQAKSKLWQHMPQLTSLSMIPTELLENGCAHYQQLQHLPLQKLTIGSAFGQDFWTLLNTHIAHLFSTPPTTLAEHSPSLVLQPPLPTRMSFAHLHSLTLGKGRLYDKNWTLIVEQTPQLLQLEIFTRIAPHIICLIARGCTRLLRLKVHAAMLIESEWNSSKMAVYIQQQKSTAQPFFPQLIEWSMRVLEREDNVAAGPLPVDISTRLLKTLFGNNSDGSATAATPAAVQFVTVDNLRITPLFISIIGECFPQLSFIQWVNNPKQPVSYTRDDRINREIHKEMQTLYQQYTECEEVRPPSSLSSLGDEQHSSRCLNSCSESIRQEIVWRYRRVHLFPWKKQEMRSEDRQVDAAVRAAYFAALSVLLQKWTEKITDSNAHSQAAEIEGL